MSSREGGLTDYQNLSVSTVVNAVKCYGNRENLEILDI